jgi:hypothetical protein
MEEEICGLLKWARDSLGVHISLLGGGFELEKVVSSESASDEPQSLSGQFLHYTSPEECLFPFAYLLMEARLRNEGKFATFGKLFSANVDVKLHEVVKRMDFTDEYFRFFDAKRDHAYSPHTCFLSLEIWGKEERAKLLSSFYDSYQKVENLVPDQFIDWESLSAPIMIGDRFKN